MIPTQKRIDFIVDHFNWQQHYEVIKYFRMDLVDENTDDKAKARALLQRAWHNPNTIMTDNFLGCIRLEGDNLFMWTTIHDLMFYDDEC